MNKEKRIKEFVCRECGKKIKIDLGKQEGSLGWKCMDCYTINSFTAPPSVKWNCSPGTTPRKFKR
jgi:phage FluMu protein Com